VLGFRQYRIRITDSGEQSPVDSMLRTALALDRIGSEIETPPGKNQSRTLYGKSFPECLKCKRGFLVPLSDYGREGATIMYKAWVCTNPECGYNIRIDNGDISQGREIKKSEK
jgi:hypothetical protein